MFGGAPNTRRASRGKDMSKPDWKNAPFWAHVLLALNHEEEVYVWAAGHADGVKAKICTTGEEFKLLKHRWIFVEKRP